MAKLGYTKAKFGAIPIECWDDPNRCLQNIGGGWSYIPLSVFDPFYPLGGNPSGGGNNSGGSNVNPQLQQTITTAAVTATTIPATATPTITITHQNNIIEQIKEHPVLALALGIGLAALLSK